MKIITFEELAKLNAGDRFSVIKKGDLQPYIFAALHPLKLDMVIAIDGLKYSKAITFSKYELCVFVAGQYDNEFVGDIMIEQLNEEIENIKSVYFKDEA